MITIANLILLQLIINTSHENVINIQIDSEDVLKLIEKIVSSDIFRSFVSQRSKKVYKYNNPYHPEDDFENLSDTFTVKGNKRKSVIEELNAQLEEKMENENSKFYDKVSDDELDDNEVENQNETRRSFMKKNKTSTNIIKRNRL